MKFDWLISYDVDMDDDIKATRLIFSCEEAVLSEGLVFLLGVLYGNLVIIWKYFFLYSFLEVYMEILLLFGNITCSWTSYKL